MAMNTDTAAQAASATKIQGLSDEVQALIGKLQGGVEATKAIWIGEGQNAFQVGSAELHTQLQKGQAMMQEVGLRAGKSGIGYGSTDSANATALGNTGT
ncbi:WXG100 family type VII secretion target [Mycolicibacterium porcinum]|uniref:WXG100 family type VII secretion target n=1 Tax=Mycolicibacterium porcinum TaxID=39693 RepID=A0ABV3VFR6_9MYCO